MAKVMSSIAKFKKVEGALREVALASQKAIEQIDLVNTSNRTVQEQEALTAAREDCLRLQNSARAAVGNFFDRVEGRAVPAKPSASQG